MLKEIKLSKHEVQIRLHDPDWVYFDKKQYKKDLERLRKYAKNYKGKLVNTTTIPNDCGNDFKKFWDKRDR